MRLKGEVYITAVRSVLHYGTETEALTKRQKAELEVMQLKMSRLSLGTISKSEEQPGLDVFKIK